MNLRRHHRESRFTGFTLLEILLATAIFAIVLVAINTVFFAGLQLRRRTTEAVEQALPVNRALAILKTDLQNAVPPGGTLSGFFRAGVSAGSSVTGGIAAGNTSGSSSSTTSSSAAALSSRVSGINLPSGVQGGTLDFFTTTGHLTEEEPWGETQQVSYELTEPLEGTNNLGRDLVRVVNRNLLTQVSQIPERERLLSNIEYFELEFYDGLQWRQVWDTTATDTALPLAVRVKLLPAVDPRFETAVREPIQMMVLLVATGDPASTNTTTEATQ